MYRFLIPTFILIVISKCDYYDESSDDYSDEDSYSWSNEVHSGCDHQGKNLHQNDIDNNKNHKQSDNNIIFDKDNKIEGKKIKEFNKKYNKNEQNEDVKGKIKRLKNRIGERQSDEETDLPRNSRHDHNNHTAGDCRKFRTIEDVDTKSTTTLINYPFSVSIQRKGAHYASGALVDKRWIITCAGEFYNTRESIKLLRARLGSVDCKKGGTVVPIKKVEIHPSYVPGQPNFDIALLRMAYPVDFTDFIRPIGLSIIKTKVISAKFMTTYWARIIVHGKVLPTTAQERIKQNSMRVSTQRLIPRDHCEGLMAPRNVTLNESTMCLKPFASHHSICTPDAGAPVVAEDGLWGITSGWVANNCTNDPSPTMFVRISSKTVRSWIDDLMIDSL